MKIHDVVATGSIFQVKVDKQSGSLSHRSSVVTIEKQEKGHHKDVCSLSNPNSKHQLTSHYSKCQRWAFWLVILMSDAHSLQAFSTSSFFSQFPVYSTVSGWARGRGSWNSSMVQKGFRRCFPVHRWGCVLRPRAVIQPWGLSHIEPTLPPDAEHTKHNQHLWFRTVPGEVHTLLNHTTFILGTFEGLLWLPHTALREPPYHPPYGRLHLDRIVDVVVVMEVAVLFQKVLQRQSCMLVQNLFLIIMLPNVSCMKSVYFLKEKKDHKREKMMFHLFNIYCSLCVYMWTTHTTKHPLGCP